MAVGDFNGDGKPDLAVANYSSANVSVLLGQRQRRLPAAVNYAAGLNPHSVAVGDFNGDGKPDLAVANRWLRGNVSVLLGNGSGAFLAAVNYAAGVESSTPWRWAISTATANPTSPWRTTNTRRAT